jgi:hypothetical protein
VAAPRHGRRRTGSSLFGKARTPASRIGGQPSCAGVQEAGERWASCRHGDWAGRSDGLARERWGKVMEREGEDDGWVPRSGSWYRGWI